MPNRVSTPMGGIIAFSIAAVMELGTQGPAAAGECFAKPVDRGHQAGHWHYRHDQARHRRCWFFGASEATTAPSAPPDAQPRPSAVPEQSWLSWFAAGVHQTFTPGKRAPDPTEDVTTAVTQSNPVRKREVGFRHRPLRHGSHLASRADFRDARGAAPRIAPTGHDTLFREFEEYLRQREVEQNIPAQGR